jgi:hypothetical protein
MPAGFWGIEMKRTKVKTAAWSAGRLLPLMFALFALALAFIAMPHAGHAQGSVRGAQEGSCEGNRA